MEPVLNTRMKARSRAALAGALCLLGLCAGGLFAAFEETAVGGRQAGMGGIGVALTDDVYAIYHNPAGLVLLPRTMFGAQYSKLHLGLDDNSSLGYSFVGYAHPLGGGRGSFGIGWLRFELSGLYNENTLIFSYAKHGLFPQTSFGPKLSVGVNLKYLLLSYGRTQYTDNAVDIFGNATGRPDSLFANYGTSKGGVDLDLGAQYQLARNYRLGLMIENLTEPNMALSPSENVPVTRAFKMGMLYTGDKYNLTVDTLLGRFNQTLDWRLAAGGERWVTPELSLRGGLTFGSRELVNLAASVGYTINDLQIDYALIYPLSGLRDTLGNHRISLTFRFGPAVHTPYESAVLARELEQAQQLRAEAEKNLAVAQQEIERLRREMEERLKEPAPTQPGTPSNAASPIEQTIANQNLDVVSPSATAAYLRELNQYRETSATINLPQRIARVSGIIRKYEKDLDVSEARQEYEIQARELKAQEKYFKDSLDYYRNMVKYGIKKEEQTEILRRMIRKYESIGVDVSDAQRELEKIQ